MEKIIQPRFTGYANVRVAWKLKNFSADYFNNPNFNYFQSPLFRVQLSNYRVAKFKLIAMRNRNTLNIYIRKDVEDRYYDDYGSLIVYFDMRLKDYYQNELIKRAEGKVEKIFFENKLSKCINATELRKPMTHFIKDQTLELVIFFRFVENKNNICTGSNTILSVQYESLFNNQNYSDYTLLTYDNDEIFVHKNILATRSPVFARMIESKMQEGNDKKAKIDDIQSKALFELIRFIYCGRVENINMYATELLYAANKYDLMDLKPLCTRALALNLTADNVIHTYILADLHQEKDLKKFTMDFIKFNYQKVKDSLEWKDATQSMIKQIMDHLMEPTPESSSINLITTITLQPRSSTVPRVAEAVAY